MVLDLVCGQIEYQQPWQGKMEGRSGLLEVALVEEYRGIYYVIRDANNFAVADVYFENESGRRAAANLMSKDEARKMAAGIARLQELLSWRRTRGPRRAT
jgi:hypothetical protein